MRLIDDIIRKRLPARTELRLVFGVIVFLVFSWSIWKFLYDLPSHLLNTNWVDIVLLFLTLAATALIESLVITLGILVLSLLLPVKWFRDGFLYKSFVTLVLLIGLMVWIRRIFVHDDYFPSIDILYIGGIIFFVTWTLLLILFHYVESLQRIVLFIEDRIEVFLWLYVPLGAAGFLVLLLLSVMNYD